MSSLQTLLTLAGAAAAGLVVHQLAHLLLRRSLRHDGHRVMTRSLVTNLRAPALFVLPLTALEIAVTVLDIPAALKSELLHTVSIALVVSVGWLVLRGTYVLYDLLLTRYDLDKPDNLHARQVRTEVQVLRRVTVLAMSVLVAAIALLSFPQVRAVGAGLLASAGLLGLGAGIAAKPVATNLVAGVQIALSQPIRVDDVVVVEGEWGRIEEIALTYVVVRVWDLRRLILPVSYFITTPFENWTRSTADILGWVFIEVDYKAPVEEIRARFTDALSQSPDWDGKVSVLQVTRLGSETMQLRALMSSADSSKSWNLQCEVREKLVGFLQREYPWALPRVRAEFVGQHDGGQRDGAQRDGAQRAASPSGRGPSGAQSPFGNAALRPGPGPGRPGRAAPSRQSAGRRSWPWHGA